VGAKVDNFYEVIKGLKAGEKVVTSANFLIDSDRSSKRQSEQWRHGTWRTWQVNFGIRMQISEFKSPDMKRIKKPLLQGVRRRSNFVVVC